MKPKLYHYWRSTSSWRVRWALALKNVEVEFVAVNLLDDTSDEPAHRARNPMGYVPVLEFTDKKSYMTESTAIIEWLDERYPQNPLYPGTPEDRARIRRLVETINSGIQPLQNFGVLLAISEDPEARIQWAQRWIRKGLEAYQSWIKESAGLYSVGNEVTAADLYLIPQCYAALRQKVELAREFPKLAEIYERALKTPACERSHPDRFAPET